MIKRLNLVLDGWGRYFKCGYPSRPFYDRIGDAVHDKEVADALGIPCVLCAVGSHAGWRLREIAPTADTLCGAVETALGLY